VVLPESQNIRIIDRIKPSVPPDWYKPYEGGSLGVPPMSAFGDGYRHHVTGLIHDELGFPTQRKEEIAQFHGRLTKKITRGFPEIMMVKEYMSDDAEVVVITYGSVARSALRAVEEARKSGVKAGLLQLITLFPFPRAAVTTVLQKCRAALVPEMNMGQISREVQRVNNYDCKVVKHNRIDGEFITPNEIYDHLVKL
jgi:2-oxoglutarate ferredoxin oxidoreductase subunit alpha